MDTKQFYASITNHSVKKYLADKRFFGAFKHNFSKENLKFTLQYPGVLVVK